VTKDTSFKHFLIENDEDLKRDKMDNDESIAQIKNNFKYESEQQKVRTEKVNKDYLFNDERDKKNLAQSDNERLIQSLDHQHLND